MQLSVTSRVHRLNRFVWGRGNSFDLGLALGPNLAIGVDTPSPDPDHPVWVVFVQPDGQRLWLFLNDDEAAELVDALVESLATADGRAVTRIAPDAAFVAAGITPPAGGAR